MTKILAALIAIAFSAGAYAADAKKDEKKADAKPAAAAASAAKKDDKKADMKPAAKAEEKKK